MHISAMNVRICFQKNTVVTDEIGNHTNEWEDYFSCYATVSDQYGNEEQGAGQMAVSEKMDFTVRYSSETAALTTDGFRIRFQDRVYNILSIDAMAFRHNSIKIHGERERRQEDVSSHTSG